METLADRALRTDTHFAAGDTIGAHFARYAQLTENHLRREGMDDRALSEIVAHVNTPEGSVSVIFLDNGCRIAAGRAGAPVIVQVYEVRIEDKEMILHRDARFINWTDDRALSTAESVVCAIESELKQLRRERTPAPTLAVFTHMMSEARPHQLGALELDMRNLAEIQIVPDVLVALHAVMDPKGIDHEVMGYMYPDVLGMEAPGISWDEGAVSWIARQLGVPAYAVSRSKGRVLDAVALACARRD